ncbi:MAG: hypothetical protein OZ921_06565 [Sorangiineae bacterium]|nr:hypothetical protein [Polyangiaceae bacterium]MEB2322157.1 hypothetical protein [Sorangiineae bacterium]
MFSSNSQRGPADPSGVPVELHPRIVTRSAAAPRGPAPGRQDPSFSEHLAARTPLEPGEAARALSRAWREVTGAEPSPHTLGALYAQWALETGRGRSMIGFNFGNLKGVGPGGKSTLMMTGEGHGRSARQVRARFRAYDGVDEGARDYVQTLARKFPRSFAAARAGDTSGFAEALAREGYFTADPVAYRQGLVGLAREYERVGPRAGALRVDAASPAVEGVLRAFQDAMMRRRA